MRHVMSIIFAVSVLSGCAGQTGSYSETRANQGSTVRDFEPKEFTYKEGGIPAYDFKNNLHYLAIQCDSEARLMNMSFNYGMMDKYRKYADNLRECKSFAVKQADAAIARFSESKPSAPLQEAVKDYYAKWNTYLGSLGFEENPRYKMDLDASSSEITAIVKFSK